MTQLDEVSKADGKSVLLEQTAYSDGSSNSLILLENKLRRDDGTLLFKKIGSALFFGVASFLITVVNKTVLTSYHFPSFLFVSIGQLIASIVILGMGKQFALISYPALQWNTFMKIFPLPLIFLGNMMFGLAGTQALSLPMFTALRRFSIMMTMFLELKMLGVHPNTAVQVSVYAMVGGAILAASDDLSFNMHGYTYVMITNVFTAYYGVCMKRMLDTTEMGKYGLMFYNSLFMFVPAMIITAITGDLQVAFSYNGWNNVYFIVQFGLSCVMGFLLTYSTMLCTEYNSALTTAIVGSLKNICVTYVGMFVGGDYIFSWLNCIGLNISVLASLLYTHVTFRQKQKPEQELYQPSKGEAV